MYIFDLSYQNDVIGAIITINRQHFSSTLLSDFVVLGFNTIIAFKAEAHLSEE
jgi:hypothetical protein